MANPYLKTIDEETVVKIASNVTAGVVNKHSVKGRGNMAYLMTYRLTGQDPPALTTIKDEGVLMFSDGTEQETISSTAAIDVYVYCNNADGDTDDIGKLIMWI